MNVLFIALNGYLSNILAWKGVGCVNESRWQEVGLWGHGRAGLYRLLGNEIAYPCWQYLREIISHGLGT